MVIPIAVKEEHMYSQLIAGALSCLKGSLGRMLLQTSVVDVRLHKCTNELNHCCRQNVMMNGIDHMSWIVACPSQSI